MADARAVCNWAWLPTRGERYREAWPAMPRPRSLRLAASLLSRGRYDEVVRHSRTRAVFVPAHRRGRSRQDRRRLRALWSFTAAGTRRRRAVRAFVPRLRERGSASSSARRLWMRLRMPLAGRRGSIFTDERRLADEQSLAVARFVMALMHGYARSLLAVTWRTVGRIDAWRSRVDATAKFVQDAWSVHARDDHGLGTRHSRPAYAILPCGDRPVAFLASTLPEAGRVVSVQFRARHEPARDPRLRRHGCADRSPHWSSRRTRRSRMSPVRSASRCASRALHSAGSGGSRRNLSVVSTCASPPKRFRVARTFERVARAGR